MNKNPLPFFCNPPTLLYIVRLITFGTLVNLNIFREIWALFDRTNKQIRTYILQTTNTSKHFSSPGRFAEYWM